MSKTIKVPKIPSSKKGATAPPEDERGTGRTSPIPIQGDWRLVWQQHGEPNPGEWPETNHPVIIAVMGSRPPCAENGCQLLNPQRQSPFPGAPPVDPLGKFCCVKNATHMCILPKGHEGPHGFEREQPGAPTAFTREQLEADATWCENRAGTYAPRRAADGRNNEAIVALERRDVYGRLADICRFVAQTLPTEGRQETT